MKLVNGVKSFGSKVAAGAAGSLAMVGTAAAAPASLDVSGAVSAIEAMAAPIGAIGLASLLIVVAIKTWKYLRRGV